MKKLTIEERMDCFYTKKGYVGISALDLGLATIKPFDDVVEKYKEHETFVPEEYSLPIQALYGLYRVMEEQYREYYDLLAGEGNKTALTKLRTYHHEAITRLTEEIKVRKRDFFKSKEKYMTGSKTLGVVIHYNEEEVYGEIKKMRFQDGDDWSDVDGGEDGG